MAKVKWVVCLINVDGNFYFRVSVVKAKNGDMGEQFVLLSVQKIDVYSPHEDD